MILFFTGHRNQQIKCLAEPVVCINVIACQDAEICRYCAVAGADVTRVVTVAEDVVAVKKQVSNQKGKFANFSRNHWSYSLCLNSTSYEKQQAK
ncbi:hypothetical protein BF33_5710 (plasmid) [Bacillus cereus]|nr:hypothetical protein BG11_5549 [Bacillus cereus]AJK37387.1 hypothetical protein BF33_5710 [Bacillus cereus]